jgi:putative ABC transport system permease protein
MRTAFNKVRRDLWRNKARTILVVLSIAVGVMALGMVTSSNYLVLNQMSKSHAASNPSHVHIWFSRPVDDTVLNSLKRIDGVEDIMGIASASIRWKTSPPEEWQSGILYYFGSEFEGQKFDKLTLLEGSWPKDYFIAVERAHIISYGLPDLGGTIYFEVNERPRAVQVQGVVRDPFQFPKPFGTQAVFYATDDMIERLTGRTGYNLMRFTLANYSEEKAESIIAAMKDKLEKQTIFIGWYELAPPDRHYLQDMINGVSMVLSVMAVASLGLSTILVVNTINALIAQQIPQIGIMKAVGGLRKQIAMLYLSGVFVYGLLSLLIAVPLGAIGAAQLSQWMLFLLNVPMVPFKILPTTFLLQIVTGLLTPLLAALYPILQGVGIAVAQALSRYGLGTGHYGARWLDQFLGRVRSLPRLFTLSLRNTFRKPGRVVLTQLTLIFAGAVFIMVVSTQYSFNATVEDVFGGFGFDMVIGFYQPQRVEKIVPIIENYPGVERAEMWISNIVKVTVPGSTQLEREVYVYGVPDNSQMFSPELVDGRLLDSYDANALLLNQKEANRLGVGVGDIVNLEFLDGRSSTWTVVGLIFDLSGNDQNTAYVPRDSLSQEIKLVGRGTHAQVTLLEDGLQNHLTVARELKEYLEANGIPAAGTQVSLEAREQANAQFSVLTQVLMIMTILMAVVGSIGMSGTLSINVIERTREIGVMRAVGASSLDVALVFIIEGLLLGIISWILALPIGMSLAPKFVIMLGKVIDFPAAYYPAFHGMFVWLGIVAVLSVFASWAPSRRATRISVNESLAYE